MTLANYAMKLEREVWGALGGPWGSDTWMAWRRDWAQKVILQHSACVCHLADAESFLFMSTTQLRQ